jgi:hypothetical protein
MLEPLPLDQLRKVRFTNAILLPDPHRREHRTSNPASNGPNREAGSAADIRDR